MAWLGGTADSPRRFRWISSVTGDAAELAALSRAMESYYSQLGTRRGYQEMIDADDSAQLETQEALGQAILAGRPAAVLEVGCGSGRMYRCLRRQGYAGRYTGLEMSAEVIAADRQRYPQDEWVAGSVYGAPFADGGYDVAFSYFVLEHCVYPVRALENMLRWARPGGAVLLVFPDFVRMGRLASQSLGFVEGRARELLRRGDVLNALFNLYESRLRLPWALRRAIRRVGPFPVNAQPRCLGSAVRLTPDVDAVYISSKEEIQAWAETRGLAVRYPAGTAGNFRENALMELVKENGP